MRVWEIPGRFGVCCFAGFQDTEGQISHTPTCVLSCVWLFATSWTASCQAPLSMGFSRQNYWSRLPFLPPGDLPDPEMEPTSLASPALAGGFFFFFFFFFTTGATWEALQRTAYYESRIQKRGQRHRYRFESYHMSVVVCAVVMNENNRDIGQYEE